MNGRLTHQNHIMEKIYDEMKNLGEHLRDTAHYARMAANDRNVREEAIVVVATLKLPFVLHEQAMVCAESPEKLNDLTTIAADVNRKVKDKKEGKEFPRLFLEHVFDKTLLGRYWHHSKVISMDAGHHFSLMCASYSSRK